MTLFFITIAFISITTSLFLFFLATYQRIKYGDESFWALVFALILLFVSFYGAVGFTYTKLKESGVTVTII